MLKLQYFGHLMQRTDSLEKTLMLMWILYALSHQGSPRILEWIAYLFSRGSSQELNWGLLHYKQVLYHPSYLGSQDRLCVLYMTHGVAKSQTGLTD